MRAGPAARQTVREQVGRDDPSIIEPIEFAVSLAGLGKSAFGPSTVDVTGRFYRQEDIESPPDWCLSPLAEAQG